ncbi:MAG: leucine-rich repeat protein [Lachnospiraceae bacterium]|nr:leucine-rich repeat protein [Lachnospiraceae bacterium]
MKGKDVNMPNNKKKNNRGKTSVVGSILLVVVLAISLVVCQFNLPKESLHASKSVINEADKKVEKPKKADNNETANKEDEDIADSSITSPETTDEKDKTETSKDDQSSNNQNDNTEDNSKETSKDKTEVEADNGSDPTPINDENKDKALDNPENNPFLPQLLNKDGKKDVVSTKKKTSKQLKASSLISTDDYEFNPDTGNLLIKTTVGLTSFATNTDIDLTTITSAVFDDSITSIPDYTVNYDTNDYSYFSKTQITSVNLNNVTIIGAYAFFNDKYLINVNMPKVTNVGDSAFYCASSLVHIDLSKITSVGTYSFSNCTSLESVDLSSLSILGLYTFKYCPKLASVNLSEDLRTITVQCFESCGIKSIDLKNVASVGYSAFGGCTKLTDVDFGDVTSLDSYSFSGCTSLKKIDISGLSIIGGGAFASCLYLSDVNFPGSARYGAYINGYYGWDSSFNNCALDLSDSYPTGSSKDSFQNQVPKVFFTLDKTSDTIFTGDSFTEPTYSLKSKTGADYATLIASKPEWLKTSATVPEVTKSGDTIDTSIPGTYTITYSIPDTYYADNNTLTYTLTVKDPNASLDSTSETFDKYSANENNKNISVKLDKGKYDLTSITNGDTTLTKGSDYSVDGDTYTFNKSYLSSLSNGSNTLTFNMSGGTTPTLTIDIQDTTPINASITPDTAVFDKYNLSDNYKDISITLDKGSYNLENLYNGNNPLSKNSQYTVDGDTYTFSKEYLSTISKGKQDFEFYMSGGTTPILYITIQDSTPIDAIITPITATFDKYSEGQNYKNISVTLNKGTYEFAAIKHNGINLSENIDYTVNGDTYTFPISYLFKLANGDNIITFNMSGGATPTLTINVEDTTPIDGSLDNSETIFDKTMGSDDYDDVSVNLNPGSYSLLSIDDNDYSLVKDQDYTKDENKYTIKKDYFQNIDEGDHDFIFKMSGGNSPQFTVHIVKSRTIDASVTPNTAVFDKNKNSKNHKNIQVLLDPVVYDIYGIKNGNYTLVKGKDYAIKENKPFVQSNIDNDKNSKAENLKIQKYSNTNTISLNSKIDLFSNLSLIDSNKTGDLYSKTSDLNGILNQGINKTSYTNTEADDVLYTILTNYLDTLKVGTHTLTFDVSEGVAPVLTINVTDTTKKDDGKNSGKNDGKNSGKTDGKDSGKNNGKSDSGKTDGKNGGKTDDGNNGNGKSSNDSSGNNSSSSRNGSSSKINGSIKTADTVDIQMWIGLALISLILFASIASYIKDRRRGSKK